VLHVLCSEAYVLGPCQRIPPAALEQHVQYSCRLGVHHQLVGLLVGPGAHMKGIR
jgi:hypothetical protein